MTPAARRQVEQADLAAIGDAAQRDVNPGHGNNAHTGENEINLAALNGNNRAKGPAGDQ